jgi:predicted component of type VI protein secretion system
MVSQRISTAQKNSTHCIQLTRSWQVSWDSKRAIHADFLPPHATINAHYYSNLLLNDVHAAIRKESPGELSQGIIVMHDFDNDDVAFLGLGNLETYSPDLAPSDYHLFGPMKEQLGRHKCKK